MKTWCCRRLRRLPFLIAGLVGWSGLSAQQPPRFTDIRSLTNRELRLELSGTAGPRYRIETGTLPGPWTPLVTLAGATSLVHTDSAAPFLAHRFYRAEALTAAGLMTGDHLTTSEGDVIIHPVYHASLVLGWNDRTIYVDPGDSAARFTGLPRADLILLTHEHGDHYTAATINSIRGTNAVILATAAVYSAMPSTLRALTTVLTNGGTTNFLAMTVEAVPAYNLTSSFHPQGRGNGYVLTLGGRRLYVSGDTEDIPELRALANIDVAFICMNLPYTMTVSQAVSAVREFRPRVVYPYHYSVTGNATAFKSQLGTDLGIEVRLRKWY